MDAAAYRKLRFNVVLERGHVVSTDSLETAVRFALGLPYGQSAVVLDLQTQEGRAVFGRGGSR